MEKAVSFDESSLSPLPKFFAVRAQNRKFPSDTGSKIHDALVALKSFYCYRKTLLEERASCPRGNSIAVSSILFRAAVCFGLVPKRRSLILAR